jgi:carboxylate-amine ligase
MRELARREPTFALHVHVGIPDPDTRCGPSWPCAPSSRAHRAVGELAVLAGARQRHGGGAAAVFGGFPRTGIPRRFADYADYVEAVDVLLRCRAFSEPTFVWWDCASSPCSGRSRSA